jgi:hypothetical protein
MGAPAKLLMSVVGTVFTVLATVRMSEQTGLPPMPQRRREIKEK